ncbi:hypothetical protein PENTCL1PPCAC_16381, partial [Pristionchus entomophagus]
KRAGYSREDTTASSCHAPIAHRPLPCFLLCWRRCVRCSSGVCSSTHLQTCRSTDLPSTHRRSRPTSGFRQMRPLRGTSNVKIQ